LDTAETRSWQDWMPTGLFFGITSNPLLLERAGEPCTVVNLERLARRAFELGAREFHAQTWGATADAMAETGFALAAMDPRVVVKVPITLDGTRVSARLIAKNVPVTTTALYAAHQAGTSMALGAAYAAPYLGRMDEAGRDGHGIVVSMQRMIRSMESPMRLLVASVRRVESIPALIEQGVDTFTLGPSLLPDLFKDDATLAATRDFERAATSAVR
jgi:transaldolase